MFLNFSKRNIIILSCLISLIMFAFMNVIIINFFNNEKFEEKVYSARINENEDEVVALNTEAKDTNDGWILKIPKIELEANINEGTTKENLENYIGHFRETSKWEGNIGLAAHNRGYTNNYFQRLDELELDDRIFYEYYGEKREYHVTNIQRIADTDWSYLKMENINKITLITCIKDEPEYRLCIQAMEI